MMLFDVVKTGRMASGSRRRSYLSPALPEWEILLVSVDCSTKRLVVAKESPVYPCSLF
jgi:hypothetical protein